jgi:hypothetical protein
MATDNRTDQRVLLRREMDKTCTLHTDTMKEVFDKIGKMVPIWVFTSTLLILCAVFSYFGYLSHHTADKAEMTSKETARAATTAVEKLTEIVQEVKSNQKVVLWRLDDISKSIDEQKHQTRKGDGK